ncbi:MAG: ExbD/TolR family protein [Akkermansiaceae bacterium]
MEFQRTERKPTTISIVPLIDILVTLLFFFIVTMKDYERRKTKSEVQINLPQAGALKVKATKVTRSTLTLDRDGRAFLEGVEVVDGLLTEYLISNLKERPGLKLALRVDEACPHGKFIEALGAASEAGYGQDDIVLPVKSSKVESPVTTPENP